VVAPGHEEDHPDLRVGEDVAERVQAVVARAVREGDGAALVEHEDLACGVTAVRDVDAAVFAGGGEQEERRGVEEAPGLLVDVVDGLVGDDGRRLGDDRAQRRLVGDLGHLCSPRSSKATLTPRGPTAPPGLSDPSSTMEP
jgi:hypothetical protein